MKPAHALSNLPKPANMPNLRSRFTTPACLGGVFIGLLGCGPLEGVHGWALETQRSVEGPMKSTSWYDRQIQALSPDGTSYRSFQTTVDIQGEFYIPDVPAGPYWLSIPDELTAIPDEARLFAWTDARELDLNFTRIGSLDRNGTYREVPITITGLSPIETGDWISATSTGNSWSGSWGLTPPGGTSTMWPSGIKTRLRSEPNEQLLVKQWRPTIRDGVTSETAIRFGSAPVPDATKAMLTVPLVEPAARTLDLQVDTAAFTAELTALPPASVRWSFSLSAIGLPKEPLAPSTLLLHVSPKAAGRDANLRGISYTDSEPVSSTRRYTLSYMGGRSHPVPGDTTLQTSCGTGVRLVGELGELSQGMARPRLSLPQGLSIDGQDAAQEGLRLGKSPTVRWSAPRIGKPSFYMLHVIRVAKLPDRGRPDNTAAHFLTTETELNIPEGVLLPGAQYFFELIAFGATDIDPRTAPRRASLLQDDTDTAHLCSTLLQTNP